MKSKPAVIFLFLILISLFLRAEGQTGSDKSSLVKTDVQQELSRLEDEWLNSYLRGDKATFDRIVADDFTGTDESGKVRTKAEERDLVQTASGNIKISLANENLRIRLYGETAIVTGRIVQKFEASDAGGFNFQSQFTDTFLKRNGRWQVVARHYSRLPRQRVSISLEPKFFDAYAGEYEIAPNVVLTVTKEADNKLTGQIAGQPKMELLPESEIEFFTRNIDGSFIFVRDESGKTAKLIINQGGQRVAAKKLK